jgi:hypothetical protein
MLLFILNEVGIELDEHTLFDGTRFSPKLTFDVLNDLSYLAMLSGTLGGLMLWLLDSVMYFHRYGRTGWFGRSYYFHSKCSLPLLQLFCTRSFVEGRYGRTSWFGRTTKNFPTRLMKLSLDSCRFLP